MYKVLGLEGPYQSICGGRTDCAVDLIVRSWTTWDSVYNEPEVEGIRFELKDTMGLQVPWYGAYPIRKEDALLRLLSNLADE